MHKKMINFFKGNLRRHFGKKKKKKDNGFENAQN